ncbi:NAD-dependent epimerase/dehydratase family protein [Rhizobium sp. AQ_MP]|nr:NAD-dependent epimerase/dehydratase family protein [Rhizobium sp. AQ_MP]
MVTGSTGFVGSNMVQTLRSNAMNVRAISREKRPDTEAINSYGADTDWSQQLKGVDCIIHLAARVHVMHETASDPIAAFREANYHATLNLARQAALSGLRRFIFVSTIKVNGERTDKGQPFTSASTPNPQDPYAISKYDAERDLFELGRSTGMEITVVRPPLVYGPGVGGNFRLLMQWAKSGLPSVFSTIKNKRSMIFIENLTDLLRVVIHHPNAANRLFLASDNETMSTHEILNHLITACGRTPRTLPIPLAALRLAGKIVKREQQVLRLTESLEVDISETKHLLGWEPPVRTSDGLRMAVRGQKIRA